MSRIYVLPSLVAVLVSCSSSAPGGDANDSDATSETSIPDDAGVDTAMIDVGAGDAGGSPSCTTETPAVTTSGAGLRVTTSHVDLYAEASEAEAKDLSLLLEASAFALAEWFARSPPSTKLKVNFFKDEAAWAAALVADGIAVPGEAGGYYSDKNETAYLYRQGNPYYSHVLAVHELVHQYHYTTRLSARSLPFWYAEGHAEYLSRHDWDGSCVRLGVTSLLSWEDMPADALASAPIDVPGIVSGTKDGSRADAWAIFRYLDTGARREAFRAYRDAFDADASASFSTLVAPPDSLVAPLTAWLPSAQEPMKPVFTEWIHVGPRSVIVDTPSYFSLAVVKATVTHFEAKLEVPASGKWTAGVVVSYTDDKHYIGVVWADDGKVKTFTAAGSAIWADLGSAPKPTGVATFAVDFSAGNATVKFGGTPFVIPVTSPRAGLAANDTRARFVDVAFSP
ncbi:MAG: hypothetical protein ACXVEE_41350 [Polyangiales bacterium]